MKSIQKFNFHNIKRIEFTNDIPIAYFSLLAATKWKIFNKDSMKFD